MNDATEVSARTQARAAFSLDFFTMCFSILDKDFSVMSNPWKSDNQSTLEKVERRELIKVRRGETSCTNRRVSHKTG